MQSQMMLAKGEEYFQLIFRSKTSIFVQILAPNADAKGQHPDLTGFASLRQDWHRAER
jgi:hypothetical protein